jgi:subtilisin-like proprotein convertase family protein
MSVLSRVVVLSCGLAVVSASLARAGCFPWDIPDDAYDGSLGSMNCCLFPFGTTVPGTVDDVNVQMALTHTFVGDLVIKIESPGATVVTLQSRAGYPESADDGTGIGGNWSNWAGATITYDDQSSGPLSETMGSALSLTSQNVCTDDGVCSYKPSHGAAAGGDLSTFDGQNYVGNWSLCVADAAAVDIGTWTGGNITIKLNRRIPCACGGKFRGGDRVKFQNVVGPQRGSIPVPGQGGQVMCGKSTDPTHIYVSWDGFVDGSNGSGYCNCPIGSLPGGNTSGYPVLCTQLALDLPWSDDFEGGDMAHWSSVQDGV